MEMTRLGPDARRLIHEARSGEDPSERDRARIQAKLALRIGAGVAATAVSRSAGATASSLSLKMIVGSVAVIVALGGTSATDANRWQKPAEPAPAPMQVQAPAQASPGVEPPAAASAPEPVVAEPAPAARPRAAAPGHDSKRPSSTAAPSAAPATIGEELRLLQQAHDQLKENDPQAALATLDRHAKNFESGALREESTAARVLALCKLGRRDEAHQLAARFLAESPSSPLAPRLRRACPDAK
jgi:hypothetical protein